MNKFEEYLEVFTMKSKTHGHFLEVPRIIDGPASPVIMSDDKRVLNFTSGSYLDMGQNKEVIDEYVRALYRFGTNTPGSLFGSAVQPPHLELRERIARYHQTEGALVFPTVTQATQSIMLMMITGDPWRMVMKDMGIKPVGDPVVIVDAHSHFTLTYAIEAGLGDKKVRKFRHGDYEHLEKIVKKTIGDRIIAVDGVYSADGDTINLEAIISIANKYDALVVVDDAHGSWVVGENGRGTGDHYGLQPDLVIGSLSKGLGQEGGFVTGKNSFIEALSQSFSQIFNGLTLAASACASIKAIDIAESEPWRRIKAIENAEYLRRLLKGAGYNALGDNSTIVPIIVGNAETAKRLSVELSNLGYLVSAFYYPATHPDEARIRITVTAGHEIGDLERFVETLKTLLQPAL